MFADILFLIAGFALLVKGADVFVDASVNIAKKLKIPSIIIGLTIVSLGTSAPEAVISITASAKGANALAIGNVVGSNIFNLLIIIGICVLVKPFAVNFRNIANDIWLSVFAGIILLLMMQLSRGYISRVFSGILLAVFIAYMIILIRKAVKSKETNGVNKENGSKPLWASIILSIAGCALIISGGQLTVNGAENIASAFGISERVIGLTILAAGTSLPELVTSIIACTKGENDIALGNVVGSNIFNLLFVLGLAGIVSPLAIDVNLIFDLLVLTICSMITILFIYTGKRLVRPEGLTMVALYAAYMVFICVK